MPEGGFLEQKPRSPTGLVIIIALHAAAIAALGMSKMEIEPKVFIPLKLKDVMPDPPPPPPEPKKIPEQKVEIRPKTQIDYVPPRVPTPPRQSDVVVPPHKNVVVIDPRASGQDEVQKPADPPKPPPPPRADPVRTQAKLDARSELQPPYPPSEQQSGSEGTVTVRVTVGADGRVKAVEKVRASSEAFFRATERHALRHWRFKPATVDGEPVESRTNLTVYFKLND